MCLTAIHEHGDELTAVGRGAAGNGDGGDDDAAVKRHRGAQPAPFEAKHLLHLISLGYAMQRGETVLYRTASKCAFDIARKDNILPSSGGVAGGGEDEGGTDRRTGQGGETKSIIATAAPNNSGDGVGFGGGGGTVDSSRTKRKGSRRMNRARRTRGGIGEAKTAASTPTVIAVEPLPLDGFGAAPAHSGFAQSPRYLRVAAMAAIMIASPKIDKASARRVPRVYPRTLNPITGRLYPPTGLASSKFCLMGEVCDPDDNTPWGKWHNSPHTWAGLANFYATQSLYSAAAFCAHKALSSLDEHERRGPRGLPYLLLLAHVHRRDRQDALALESVIEVYAIDNFHHEARQMLRDLDPLGWGNALLWEEICVTALQAWVRGAGARRYFKIFKVRGRREEGERTYPYCVCVCVCVLVVGVL